ncbi:MAG TPA: undecaprenyl-diphosphatase UppP [Rectinemataceae bacterium]|nr:undecaprenyl-diphosphatase UppP [Rectinemataceae bacterium]
MLAFQSAILGLVQGITEFLPISSSAHLIIVPWLFNWTNPTIDSLSFDVALHLGTLLAVLVFFWSDWVRLVGAWFTSIFQRKIGEDSDRRMAWFLVLGTIPGALAGLLFEGKVTTSFHVAPIPQLSMVLMALVLALLGLMLWLVDRGTEHLRSFGQVDRKDAALVGLAQALAIFPGVSRSGATITAGRALGLDRATAAKFSFLLSAPIIAGSGLASLYHIVKGVHSGAISGAELSIFPIGFAVAAVSGFLCIKFLLSFLQRHSFRSFAVYRFALAALVLVVALSRGTV